MSATSDDLENKLLDHVLGGPDYTRLATVYLALFSTATTDAGGGTELTGGGYARIAVTNNATNWPAAAGGSKSNGVAITFAAASGAWATATHFAIMSALTGGVMLFHGPLTTSKTVASGETPRFSAGAIVISQA